MTTASLDMRATTSTIGAQPRAGNFSKPWLGVAQRLGLKRLRYEVLSHNSAGSILSTVSVFELVGGQQLVASTNANGFPLSGDDFGRLQEILRQLR